LRQLNLISKYQSWRVDYLNAFWNAVDGECVGQRLESVLTGKVPLWPVTHRFSTPYANALNVLDGGG